MKISTKPLLLGWLFFILTSAAFAGETSDSTADRIADFKLQQASVVPRESLVRDSNSLTFSSESTDTAYDVLLGDGTPIYLWEIANKMGNPDLAKKLRIGRLFPYFVAGLCISAGYTVAAGIIGPVFIAAYYYDSFFSNNEGIRTSGIIILSTCSISLGGVVAFAVMAGLAYKHKMNFLQAKALVNQYNRFLRKKMAIPDDIEINYNFQKQSIGLALSFRF